MSCLSPILTQQHWLLSHPCSLDSEDEEFYDCSAEEPNCDMKDERRGSKHRLKHSLWNQPVGRLSKHGNLRLLNTGEHLYIPVTQV